MYVDSGVVNVNTVKNTSVTFEKKLLEYIASNVFICNKSSIFGEETQKRHWF